MSQVWQVGDEKLQGLSPIILGSRWVSDKYYDLFFLSVVSLSQKSHLHG